METYSFIGVVILIVLVLYMLRWQKRLWDASDAARYYAKYPPDSIEVEVHYKDLTEEQIDTLIDLEISICEAMGLDMAGGPDRFVSIGMKPEQLKHFRNIVEAYFLAINRAVDVVGVYHYNENEEDEDENGDEGTQL